jgi:hypothetical protein
MTPFGPPCRSGAPGRAECGENTWAAETPDDALPENMLRAPLRLLGLLLLALGITVSSCQALFPLASQTRAQQEITSGSRPADSR